MAGQRPGIAFDPHGLNKLLPRFFRFLSLNGFKSIQIRVQEPGLLLYGRVLVWMQLGRLIRVIVSRPFAEMVTNVKATVIVACILEIDDYKLTGGVCEAEDIAVLGLRGW